MGIAVLGPLTIEGDLGKALGRRDRVVLAALAVRPGHVVSSEELAEVVWSEQRPSSWPKVIQGCVVRLRKILGVNAIETLPLGYRLAVPLDEIDAQRFERAIGRARGLLAADEFERSALVLADALTLWRGPPLTELESWDTARIEAERLGELLHAAEELYVDAALRSGQHQEVLAKAQTLVNEAPLRERRWVLLATAQYQAGRQAEALRTIHRLRAVLNRELGLDPSEDIDSLEQAILRQDPSLVAEHALPDPDRDCPYPGLKAYDLDDADTFFGRDTDIAACLRKLADTSVLAVVGPSGCGKSSLVRAGVAASLRRDGRRVVVMTPGAHPVTALTAALPTSGPAPALVVDQCEEVFSLCRSVSERDQFLSALAGHQAPLILSIRADRLADISAHPVFARTVERGLHLLSAMKEDDLRAAIEQPARLASLVVEPGLVDLLVNEVADQPGALPLMSHALGETWQRREGRTLTVAGYNASGGIRGAVAQSAEQVYERIPPEQRPVLRDLLLRLVTPGPEGEPIRSRLPRRLVVTGPDDASMIDLLAGARLVTSDEGVVELAHESLARAWPRLRDWLDDDLEGQQILHHLARTADAWDGLGRPDSELYRGVRLAKASEWRDRSTSTLTQTEQDFLTASKQASRAELRAAEDQARHQVHINRRLRAALATAAALLAGALIAGFVAVRQADLTEQAATTELARRVGARALLTEGISHSLLLAAQGVRLDDSAETRANLIATMNKRPLLLHSTGSPLGRTENVEISADGRRILSGDGAATFHLYDAKSGQVLDSYTFEGDLGGGQFFTDPRFSPDGRLVSAVVYAGGPVAAAAEEPPLRLLNADTLDPVSPQPKPLKADGKVRYLDHAFSADGRYLAASIEGEEGVHDFSSQAYALIWDLRALGRAPRMVSFPGPVQVIALSPDGSTIYCPWPFSAYDVATGQRKWQRPELPFHARIEASAQGDLLAVQQFGAEADQDTIALVDANTGATVKVLRSQVDTTRGQAFSADGKLLAAAEQNGEVVVWDVATGTVRERIDTSEVSWAVDFSPDGQTLYTAGDEGILRVYDLAGQRRYLPQTRTVPARRYLHVLRSDDGLKTAYLWRDAKGTWVSFADADTTTAPIQLSIDLKEGPQAPAAWHPDGRRLSIHDADTVETLDSRTGKVLEVREHQDITSLGYVGLGERLVAGSDKGIVFYDEKLWPEAQYAFWPADCCTARALDGRTAMIFEHFPDGAGEHWRIINTDQRVAGTERGRVSSEGNLPVDLNHATYSPDGRLVAGVGAGGQVLTIDVRSGQVRRAPTISHNDEGVVVRFSPDSSRLVSSARDGTVSLWDTQTLDLLGTVSIAPADRPVAAVPSFVDGNDVVTIAAYDGTTYRWDTSVDRTLAYACAMAGRNLTTEEWTQAFGDRPYEKTCP